MAKKKTFEEELKKLEAAVKELESGNLSLDQAMKTFETGMEHSRFCLEQLEQTQAKITRLVTDASGELKEEPFDHE